MAQSYTTSYSTNEERFGFTRKGTFNCRLKYEKAVIVFILAVSVVFDFILISHTLGAPIFGRSLTAAFWDYVIILLIVAVPIACITLIRIALGGEEYRFTANDEKMLITCAKRDLRADVYYDNVAAVNYENIKSFSGKIRGFRVVITCRDGGSFIFDFLFRWNMQIRSKDMTPFVIIEERAGLLEQPEFFAGRRIDAVKDYRR